MKYKSKTLVHLSFAALGMFILMFTASAQTSSNKLDYDNMLYVPCADGGNGEMVHFTGTLHQVVSIQQDNNGCYHVMIMYQPMGLKGIGQTTGDTYKGVGATQTMYQDERFCGDECEFTRTYHNTQMLVGPGKGNNYKVVEVYKFTFNVCTGEMDTQVDRTIEDCK